MTVSIDWGTKVIFVPKDDLTLIQELPTEIREMSLNWFRLQLKNLEDSENGMVNLDTHSHNTEVSLGGLTYARIIEIINNYTVTFEDGAYAVNLTGANSNVGDRVNVNSVSVRSANSAGMTSSPDIEYSSFNGMVTIDVTATNSGTTFPIGTPRQPVNNIPDARLIREYRGLPHKFHIKGNIVIGDGDNIDGYDIEGDEPSKSTIVVLPESQASDCVFTDCMLTGTLDGNSTIKDGVIYDLDYVNGFVYNCLLSEVGTITLAGNVKAYFLNCFSGKGTVHGDGFPTIDCGGTGPGLVMHNYNGDISLMNKTGPEAATINLNAGAIELQASCVAGSIECQGTGSLEDYTPSSCSVHSSDLMNSRNISSSVWDEPITDHLIAGSTGLSVGIAQFNSSVHIANDGVSGTAFPIGTGHVPVNNIMDAYAIALENGIFEFHVHTDFTILSTDVIQSMTFVGRGSHNTKVTFESGCVVAYCGIKECFITGETLGLTLMENCRIKDYGGSGAAPSDKTILLKSCAIEGALTLPANYTGIARMVNCYSIHSPTLGPPTVNFNGGAFTVLAEAYSGVVAFENGTNAGAGCSIDLISGAVTLMPTVTAGTFKIRGVGTLDDQSTSVTELDTVGLLDTDSIADSVWKYERT